MGGGGRSSGRRGRSDWGRSLGRVPLQRGSPLLAGTRRAAQPQPFPGRSTKDRLPALFAESLERQEEVTEHSAARCARPSSFCHALDQLDRESDGTLWTGPDDDFYAGAVTVMMRVVFLLFAEERRLLPSDDDPYVTAYSVGHLVEQLEQQAAIDPRSPRTRTAAWHRLLAVTRAVHSGVAHEDLRLPPTAVACSTLTVTRGSKVVRAATPRGSRPPAVDDRTVLRMLRAVQYVAIGSERRRLTFRALDVEQIGYVYEGLLELEVRTATEIVLGLQRPNKWPQKIKEDAEVTLADATTLKVKDFTDRTGWSAKKVQAALASPAEDPERLSGLQRQVTNADLAAQITPYLGLLRFDELGLPAVTVRGGRYVTRSHRRAATGTHYTPRSLAEEVAEGALEPLVYRPGPLETSDSAQWRIRPSSQIKATQGRGHRDGLRCVPRCGMPLSSASASSKHGSPKVTPMSSPWTCTAPPAASAQTPKPTNSSSRPAGRSPSTVCTASTSSPSQSRWRS